MRWRTVRVGTDLYTMNEVERRVLVRTAADGDLRMLASVALDELARRANLRVESAVGRLPGRVRRQLPPVWVEPWGRMDREHRIGDAVRAFVHRGRNVRQDHGRD